MANKQKKTKKNFSVLLRVLVAAVLLWGIALRAPEVISGNFIFNFDAGRDLLAARRIVEEGKLTLIGAEIGSGSAGINGIFQGPGYYYLLAIPYWLFGGNPYGALLLMFVFGVAALVAAYKATRRMFGEKTALLATLLFGISPLLTSQSRFIWSPHPGTILLVAFFYCMYRVLDKPRLFVPLAALAAGFTYHFEFAMTVPLVVALFFSLPLVYRIKDIKTYIYATAATVFSFLPLILFEIRHGFMAVNSALSYSSSTSPVGWDIWWLRIADHVKSYMYNAINSFPTEHGFLSEAWYRALTVGLILALILFAVRVKDSVVRRFFQFCLLLLLVVSYGVFFLLDNTIWDYYLIHAHFVFIWVFAYAFALGWRGVVRAVWAKTVVAVLGVFLVSMAGSTVWRMKSNFTYDLYDLGGFEKIAGKKIAVDYIYEDANGQEFSEFTFTPPIYTYPYDYLFLTYGKSKYGYVPGDKKEGLVYLIIEPDPSKPWTYKGWLETVIVEGDIIDTVTLPTGHIIQKRMFH